MNEINVNRGLKWLVGILSLLVIIMASYLIYDKLIRKDNIEVISSDPGKVTETTETVSDNKENDDKTDTEDKYLNVYGTYYNSDLKDIYFTLNNDGTAIFVESTCSEGAADPINVKYTLEEIDNKLTLVFLDDDFIMSNKMIGIKDEGGNYKFTTTVPTCVANPNETYYIKK